MVEIYEFSLGKEMGDSKGRRGIFLPDHSSTQTESKRISGLSHSHKLITSYPLILFCLFLDPHAQRAQDVEVPSMHHSIHLKFGQY